MSKHQRAFSDATRFSARVALCVFWGACGSSDNTVSDDATALSDSSPSAADASPAQADADPFAPDGGPCVPAKCGGQKTECLDCEDNDLDGFTDSEDPECLGPCDNTEGPELTAGVAGETGGPCKADCYWDFGNGAGLDQCYWDSRCDPLAVAPDYPPEGEDCAYEPDRVGSSDCPDMQSDQCLAFCIPMTPNGCDCFGCCTAPDLDGGAIWIGAMDDANVGTCTFESLEDPSKCPPCTQVEECLNECGECELCFGMTELPPWCTPEERCPENVQPCGLDGDEPCPDGYFCITGCCQPIIE